jgi:hypothetical protein
MGPQALATRVQAGSVFVGIDDTIAIGHILYCFGFPIVTEDNLWVPARENPARISIVPIGYIHISREANPVATTEINSSRSARSKPPYRPLLIWICRRDNQI